MNNKHYFWILFPTAINIMPAGVCLFQVRPTCVLLLAEKFARLAQLLSLLILNEYPCEF